MNLDNLEKELAAIKVAFQRIYAILQEVGVAPSPPSVSEPVIADNGAVSSVPYPRRSFTRYSKHPGFPITGDRRARAIEILTQKSLTNQGLIEEVRHSFNPPIPRRKYPNGDDILTQAIQNDLTALRKSGCLEETIGAGGQKLMRFIPGSTPNWTAHKQRKARP